MRKARLDHVVHVSVAERTEEAAKLLHEMTGVKRVNITEEDARGSFTSGRRTGERAFVIDVTLDENVVQSASDIPNRLINAGFRLTRFTEETVNLETAFMRLTQGLVQ
jgi:hypothetical protein